MNFWHKLTQENSVLAHGNIWVHKIILANQRKWRHCVQTEKCLCTQENWCVDTTLFDWFKLFVYTLVFVC